MLAHKGQPASAFAPRRQSVSSRVTACAPPWKQDGETPNGGRTAPFANASNRPTRRPGGTREGWSGPVVTLYQGVGLHHKAGTKVAKARTRLVRS
jgi:hypothetical protein